ncbi:hypothetical protein [Microscilla marina]|uniref:Uncharacterized protein n=1 Tax=Microscilla marina ATCC 23134 TaxID=313606 RepID=A1ZKR8_MICM2|nr:hypothetical protein [Microscilla marina]EAY28884.1 hypothetical protein M23134_00038 [Microscilla marina ATCC 23134]
MASLQPATLNPDYLLALLHRAGVSTVELLQQAPQAQLIPVANESTARCTQPDPQRTNSQRATPKSNQ